MAPNLRRLAVEPLIDLRVAYCSLKGAKASYDPGFGTTIEWDIPLLDGYDWVEVENLGNESDTFWGFCNPGLWRLIREGNFDAVLCYTGYIKASFWLAYFACRVSQTSFLFGTDASALTSRSARRWKILFKKLFWPLLYSLADQVIVPSSATRRLMLSLSIPSEKITLTPFSVDNNWWVERSAEVDREAVRKAWGATSGTCVFLFCGKLQFWKRPMDVLQAFASMSSKNTILVFAGDGQLRSELEPEAKRLGVADRVNFLGFVNQSQLPAIYTSADLMVLPSEYEPFAVVVNEAFCCGCPVAASDRVGAAGDLISPVDPSLIFPCGDVPAISKILEKAVNDRAYLAGLGQAARQRIVTWSPNENVASTVEAVQCAVKSRKTTV